ncbi:MAG TPA: glycosyltransferase family 9 protein, partial [Myxococcota bacterium]|nr:glycosyltransferase family 9 protein [Myxococcota bacterium]
APRLRIPLPPADPAGPVVIAPGSGGVSKRLPLAFWEALHHRLADLPVVWVAGPVEAEEHWPVEPLRLGLCETAELAARCRCWLGPDAGPSHLAAAAGARVGVVFQTTDPTIWAPSGAAIFEDPTVEELEGWVRE